MPAASVATGSSLSHFTVLLAPTLSLSLCSLMSQFSRSLPPGRPCFLSRSSTSNAVIRVGLTPACYLSLGPAPLGWVGRGGRKCSVHSQLLMTRVRAWGMGPVHRLLPSCPDPCPLLWDGPSCCSQGLTMAWHGFSGSALGFPKPRRLPSALRSEQPPDLRRAPKALSGGPYWTLHRSVSSPHPWQ